MKNIRREGTIIWLNWVPFTLEETLHFNFLLFNHEFWSLYYVFSFRGYCISNTHLFMWSVDSYRLLSHTSFLILFIFLNYSPGGSKHLPALQETGVWSLGGKDPLEKEMATHSSTLAQKIPRTEESGRLQSMGSQRVGHDWVTSLPCFLIRQNADVKAFTVGVCWPVS